MAKKEPWRQVRKTEPLQVPATLLYPKASPAPVPLILCCLEQQHEALSHPSVPWQNED